MGFAWEFSAQSALTKGGFIMPKQWGDLSKEEKDRFEDMDISGEEGGDTGPAAYIDDGKQAEKGDARRDKPAVSDKAKNKDKTS